MNDDEFPCFHRDNLKTADLVEFCRRLQLNEPLEPLLRDWKTKERCEKCKSFTKKAKSGHKSNNGEESWGRDSGARDLSPGIPASSGTDSQLTENETGTCDMLDLASQALPPSTLEESIIRTLNEKYKDFSVDDNGDVTTTATDLAVINWDAKKVPLPPGRSQSWLCCPTIYQGYQPDEQPVQTQESPKSLEAPTVHQPQSLQLQASAVSALRSEVLALSNRLQRAENGRELMEKELRAAIEEKVQAQRRLDSIGTSHESRITEMHCIIAELSRKLKAKEECAIMEEEHEGSVSDLSFQEGSVYNSDLEAIGYGDQSRTEPLDTKLEQPDRRESFHESLQSFPNVLPAPHLMCESNSFTKIEVLQEEVLHLRAQVALLRSQLASRDDDRPYSVNDEEFMCRSGEMRLHAEPAVNMSEQKLGSSAQFKSSQVGGERQVMPVAKMAERVKLRQMMANDEDYVTGSEILNTGIDTTAIAEHLVSDLCQNVLGGGPLADIGQQQLEMEQQQRRIEYLKVSNTVLSLTMAETKQHCDQLYLLCGKYESNAIALQQALNYSDRAIEAYDVMLALFESRLDIIQNDPNGVKNKEDAETVAHHLLDYLEHETDMQSNSLGPWQNTVLVYPEKNRERNKPWRKDDDNRLRSHISKLKGSRASVQNTVVVLESPYHSDETNKSEISSKCEDETTLKRMDLETAVLMQELMSMRDDVGEYKQRAEQAQQEKKVVEEQLSTLQEALCHLQDQLKDSETQVTRERSSYSEAEHMAGIERELLDALARESRLKTRLQGLAGSVEAATKSSKEKYSQVQNTVAELKHVNLTLNQSLERCKRKYETKVKRLENQLQELTARQQGNAGRLSPKTRLDQAITVVSKKGAKVPETTL